MTKIKYEKDNGDISNRDVIAIGFDLDNDTVLCIDATTLNTEERKTLETFRQLFLDDLYEADLGGLFRSFKHRRLQVLE